VDVPGSLATQLYFARWSPAGVIDADVRDEARALWNEAREAARGHWVPAELTVDGAPHPAHRLDHECRWVAFTEIDSVVLYVLSYGTPIGSVRLERLADTSMYL
jgi:hypothetical protein